MSKPQKPNPHRRAGDSVAAKRRLALKTVGGGALVSGLLDRLPQTWQSPLVGSAVLPAHAQASFTLGQFTFRYIRAEARSDLLTAYRITPLDQANSRYLLSIDRGGSTQFVQVDSPEQGLGGLIPAALAQQGGLPTGLSVAEQFDLEFGREHTVNTPAFGHLLLSDGRRLGNNQMATCRFPVSAWLDAGGTPQFAGGRDIHAAVGEPCGPAENMGMFYAGQGFLNDQARLGPVPAGESANVPLVQFDRTGYPDRYGWDYFGRERAPGQVEASQARGERITIHLSAAGPARSGPLNVWLRGITGEGASSADSSDYTVRANEGSDAQLVGDQVRFRVPIDVAGAGSIDIDLNPDDLPDEGIETLVLEIEPSPAYRVGARYQSRVSIYEPGSILPTTAEPLVETPAPTTGAPAATTTPEVTQAPVITIEGRIGLAVMDANGDPLATMTFNYEVQRSAGRIDYIRFPATTAGQMTMHQPADKVLGILFPEALAQADELHLTDEVELDFTDGVLTKTETLPLQYNDAACTGGEFTVSVTLHQSRRSIAEIDGNSDITDCGSVQVTVEGVSGFGTFTPPPPDPTTTATATLDPSQTTAAPTAPATTTTVAPTTTLGVTRVGFRDAAGKPQLIEGGGTFFIAIDAVGDSPITFDVLRVMSSEAVGTDLSNPSNTNPAGATLDTNGDKYDHIGISLAGGGDTTNIQITAVADGDNTEGSETITFEIANLRGADPGYGLGITPNAGEISIVIADNDKPLVQFAQSEYHLLEGETVDIEFDVQGWEHSAESITRTVGGDKNHVAAFVVTRVNPTDTNISGDFSVADYGGGEVAGTVRPVDTVNGSKVNDDPNFVQVMLIQQRDGSGNINADDSSAQEPGTDSQGVQEGGVRFRFTAKTDANAENMPEVITFQIGETGTDFVFNPGNDGNRTYNNSQIRVGPQNEVKITIYDMPVVRWEMPSYVIIEPKAGAPDQNQYAEATIQVVFTPVPATLPNVYFRVSEGAGVMSGVTDQNAENAGIYAVDDDYKFEGGSSGPTEPASTSHEHGPLWFMDTTVTQTIRVYRDRLVEGNETITLTLVENPVDASAYAVDSDVMKNQTMITLIDTPPIPTTAAPTTIAPTVPPTTAAPITDPTTTGGGGSTYTWTWSGGVYTVNGEFTLKDTASASGTIDESHLATHTYTITRSDNTDRHEVDLVNGTYSLNGTAESFPEFYNYRHDFQYTLGATRFLQTRTDSPAHGTNAVHLTRYHTNCSANYHGLTFTDRWDLYLSDCDGGSAANTANFTDLVITPPA